jgi:CubicO group peptidase (beta-lactamase class C family)
MVVLNLDLTDSNKHGICVYFNHKVQFLVVLRCKNMVDCMSKFKTIMKHLFILFFITHFEVGVLSAQRNDNVEIRIDSMFSKYNSQSAGLAVVIVKDGEVILKKGYGMANLEYDIPNTPQTIFHVASVSKQFTAFAIYLLESEGKIKLNDDIRKYIPELPVFVKPITINHLVSHTSGLKDQWALLTLAGWRMDDVITTEQILKVFCKQKELNFTPGTQYKYSNTGFTFLSEIIKRVSGKSFAEFVKEKIFIPLEMNNSQFYDNNDKIVKNRAYSYGTENSIFVKRNLNYSTAGPTSLFTTAEDLAKWVMNFENPRVGDKSLIERFHQISTLENKEPAVLAVVDGETIYHLKGQFKRNYKGLNVYNHTGSDAGFKSYLGRFQDNKLSIILLSNDDGFLSYKAGMDIAEFYLSDKFKKREIYKEAVQIIEEKPKPITLINLKDFEGTYQNDDLSSAFSVKLVKDKLVMTHNRLSDVVLTEVGNGKFKGIISFSAEMNFIMDKKGKVTALSISNFGATDVKFRKIK